MKIMGIVNVTPDSFSDGGSWADPAAAIAHGRELMDQGATILDIGGESTRPGFTPLTPKQEWERIGEVVRVLSAEGNKRGVQVSVDTYHADTARWSVEAGAHIVNDVTGGLADPEMLSTVAGLDCDYILQHMRGDLVTMDQYATYTDVVAEVFAELKEARDRAVSAGIARERIILDPGLGFAKPGEENWVILRAIDELNDLGHRVLIGQSRKRFIGDLVGGVPTDRDVPTAVISGYLALHNVWATRVHNVAASVAAVATALKLQESAMDLA
ncbi:MAG: dihydropteroate synthase [Actinomycetaceae bacterium]|nr:dihydropteroate synthase [Actinomycetaceae bacterium]